MKAKSLLTIVMAVLVATALAHFLPPGYKGEVPDGYFVVRSKTCGVWNFTRGYGEKGVAEAVDRIKGNLRVYPLAKKDNPPQVEFTNMSGLADYKTIPANDFSFHESLIASLGIVKGQPYNPDPRMRRILTKAVATGNASARANIVFRRDPDHRIYPGTESEWVAFPAKDTSFLKDGARQMVQTRKAH